MRYSYITLNDDTEITYTEMTSDDHVNVYIETPSDDGFHSATCILPENEWKDVQGYSKQEMIFFHKLIWDNTDLIMQQARKVWGEKTLLHEDLPAKMPYSVPHHTFLAECLAGGVYGSHSSLDIYISPMQKAMEEMGKFSYICTEKCTKKVVHALAVMAFAGQVYGQLEDNRYRLFTDHIEYRVCIDGEMKVANPSVSITSLDFGCKEKERIFYGKLRFALEIGADEWETEKCYQKLDLYREMEVEEVWIMNLEFRSIDTYVLKANEKGNMVYEWTGGAGNMEKELHLATFPHVTVDCSQLYDEDYFYEDFDFEEED